MLRNLALSQADAAAMLSFQTDRAKQMRYPMRDGQVDPRYRLAAMSYVLYVPQQSALRWDGLRLDLPEDEKVGVNRGWAITRELKARRIASEEGGNMAENFAKLQAGRIAAFAMHEPGGDAYLAGQPQLHMKSCSPAQDRKQLPGVQPGLRPGSSGAHALRLESTAAAAPATGPALSQLVTPSGVSPGKVAKLCSRTVARKSCI